MTDPEFTSMVQEAATLDSESEAERAAEATLSELGRCISPGEARDLASRLPERFGRPLLESADAKASPEPLEEFLENVAEAGDIEGDVRTAVRGVTGAVAEYAGADELQNAAAQLPPEYGAVLEPADVSVSETFVDAVASASSLSGEEAATAAEATLSTLGERLTREEAEDVAAHLHGDADEWLVEEHSGDAEDVPLEEFVERVAARAEVPEAEAREYVSAVTGVLGDVAPDRELERARDQLPDEYGGLVAFA